MSDIDHLRQRVEAAEKRFGVITEQQNNYSQRIIGLMNSLESDVAKFRDESKKHETEIERLHFENEQLRSMLHSLLLSVESDRFVETMRELDGKVTALLAGEPVPDDTEADSVNSEATPPAEQEDADPAEAPAEIAELAGDTIEDSEVAADDTTAEAATAENVADEDAAGDEEPALADDGVPDAAEPEDIETVAETAEEPEPAAIENAAADAVAIEDDGAGESVAALNEPAAQSEPAEMPDQPEVEAAQFETEDFELAEAVEPTEAAVEETEPAAAAPEAKSVELPGDELTVDDLVSEEPAIDEPVIEDPVIEEPVAEAPAMETPPSADAVAEDPVIEEPAAAPTAEPAPVEEEPQSEASVKDIIDRVSELVKDLAEAEAASEAAQTKTEKPAGDGQGPASAVGS